MERYQLQGKTYRIGGYDELPPFSSFLPGLAGVKGIPLWAYYTNRGQGINSFGIHHKNNAIMEFNPANTAYENTPLKGFRTFIKCNGEYFEPFLTRDSHAERNLYIKKNSLEIEEINHKFGLNIKIKYFILPNDSIGALVRKVEITNLDDSVKELEVIDGLPKIIPYGITNAEYKEMSNLLKSWTEIKNIERHVPFYTRRASSDDSAELSEIEGGYFYLTVMGEEVKPVVYDADVIFDQDTSLLSPVSFLRTSLQEIEEREQCFYNKVPCGFTILPLKFHAKEAKSFFSMVGFASSTEQINDKLVGICSRGYLGEKEKQAEELVERLTGDVRTHTAKPEFDQYIEQCYLDNFLRGGYPFVFNQDSNKAVVHLFSRKHGDPERDYNFFSIAGEYYSQGNGNFRDVSQNRRNDVFFHHEIGDFNIKTFFQLLQIDGYNPLEVRPSSFKVKSENQELVAQLLKENINVWKTDFELDKFTKTSKSHGISDTQGRKADIQALEKTIQKSFTPGQVANCIARSHIQLCCGEDAFLEKLLSYCSQNIEAGFGEGYWSDHWDYNMDLIESYLSIYPEKKKELLFEDHSYRFYDSAVIVMPRSETYVFNSRREVRQYGSIEHDREKEGQIGFHKGGTNWLKTASGECAQTSLMAKMISLALNKFTLLDSYGMGVEMEGGKPGWNDAMNGIPGLFGSGMPETFELKRLLSFVQTSIHGTATMELPVEVYNLLTSVHQALVQKEAADWSDFTYWDTVATMRERYREDVRFHISGKVIQVKNEELHGILSAFAQKVELGIKRALSFGDGIVPTYFTYQASDFEAVVDDAGNPVLSHCGLPKVKVKAFKVRPVPSFLEAPTKMLASRIRAFTPGWLERESIFLHMEYKYLLSMLKAGLYERYYEELPSTMIAFRDPREYGRSILENSSFLASSTNPNKQIHGRGYVSRLSGSTTEAISLWIHMFMGDKLFSFENGELKLEFNPKLVNWLFDERGEAAFTLLSKCKVTYHNPSKRSTFGTDGVSVQKIVITDTKEEALGNVLSGEMAKRLRNGEIKGVLVYLG